MTTHIIHHANCPDGFTAAWLIHNTIATDTRIHAANYGDEPPIIAPGDDVYVVDFCYEPEHLVALVATSGRLVVLDHHETSRQWMIEAVGADKVCTDITHPVVPGADSNIYVSDMERSGAGLAAHWIHGADYLDYAPPFVKYVQDRDLWRWQLKGTAEVFAAVTARPYTLNAWDDLAELSDQELIDQGAGIAMYRQRLIEQTVDTAWRATVAGHDDIWVAACPYALGSDVAGELAERDPDRFAAYFIPYENRMRFGLRSADTGMNVAEVAAQFGGGGHAHASGFEIGKEEL